MAFNSFRLIAETHGLLPNEKLVLFQLASFENSVTGQCNPSIERIAYYTGLAADQTRRLIKSLINKGYISNGDLGYVFNFQAAHQYDLIPSDYWPSPFAIEAIQESFPRHHFDTQEAVNDFINFVQSNDIRVQPERFDFAFIRNISAILSQRPEGNVKISGKKSHEEASAASSFFPQSVSRSAI